MRNRTSVPSIKKSPISPKYSKLLTAIITGVSLFFGSLLFVWFGYQFYYSGKIYPGISVAGVDLSGLRIQEAYSYLAERYSYPSDGLITFSDQDHVWDFHPNELGLTLDDQNSVKMAYSIGRNGWPWNRVIQQYIALEQGIKLSPKMVYNENIAAEQLTSIANQVYQPMAETNLKNEGMEIIYTPGQVGKVLDLEATISSLPDIFINNEDGRIDLVILEQNPIILDAAEQAGFIDEILSQSLTLSVPDQQNNELGPWVLDPLTLANMLSIQRIKTENGESFSVGLSENSLRDFLVPIRPGLIETSENAMFIFNDDTLLLDLIKKAKIGRELLIEESIQKINQEILQGNHNIELVFDYLNPDILDEMTGEELGITELVSAQTSYFYGSSAARMQNIQTAAAQFHGLMVPPGGIFSMVENIGDISLNSGYAEALIIFGDRTIKGVGGGVCQVSTTLFRTAFFGGFPVDERYSHAYRVSYYEQVSSGAINENLAGLDATVYSPIIDFKFTNDTPHWLLLETYVSIPNRRITWKFYSTSDNRIVEWNTTGLQNIVEPPNPIYEENDELEKGQIKQVDWGIDGADVTVDRTVWRDGEIHFSDRFVTHYRSWTTICQYGPETENYPPAEDDQNKYGC